jgi:hypothetical protein
VLSIHGFLALGLGWFAAVGVVHRWMMDTLLPRYFRDQPELFTALAMVSFVPMLIPAFLPWLLRRRAKRRLQRLWLLTAPC